MKRATLSMDGVHRTTIRISHRVSAGDVYAALFHRFQVYGVPERVPGKAASEEIVRKEILDVGMDNLWDSLSDADEDSDYDEIVAVALQTLERNFCDVFPASQIAEVRKDAQDRPRLGHDGAL